MRARAAAYCCESRKSRRCTSMVEHVRCVGTGGSAGGWVGAPPSPPMPEVDPEPPPVIESPTGASSIRPPGMLEVFSPILDSFIEDPFCAVDRAALVNLCAPAYATG